MSYHLSDEDSSDSDSGVRFKTTNTRSTYNTESSKLSYNAESCKKDRDKHESKYKSKPRERKDKNIYKITKTSSSDSRKHRKTSNNCEIYNKRRKHENKVDEKPKEKEKKDICFGPLLPPKLDTEKTGNDNFFGPSIPPHLSKKIEKSHDNHLSDKSSKIIGPVLPPFLKNNPQYLENTVKEIRKCESDSEDDVIGPLPDENSKNIELEERALQFKLGLLNKTDKESTSREEWMLELPEIRAPTQVGARKFRTKEMPDVTNRSVWTETAKDRATKKTKEVDLKLEAKLKHLKDKDLMQEKIIEKQKKHTSNKSLVDLHQDKLEKRTKEKKDTSERRPFNRDIDLKVNKFDAAQTKIAIKKAHLLDSKFASGQSKFL